MGIEKGRKEGKRELEKREIERGGGLCEVWSGGLERSGERGSREGNIRNIAI
jgi:hypothetical protein